MPKRFIPPGAEEDALRSFGERLADHLGVPVTDVRHAKYDFHNGSQWTVRTCWEQRRDGQWIELTSGEMPTGLLGR